MTNGRIQDDDIKTVAELVAAGASAAKLPNASKIYVTSLLSTLDAAITSGKLSGFNKVVGTGGFASIAAATPTAGDRILVATSYSIAAAETISANDVEIVFRPGVVITVTGGTYALRISGNRVKVRNPYYSIGASLTAGILIESNAADCIVDSGFLVVTAGTTTDAFRIDAVTVLRARVMGNVVASGGTVTNPSTDLGTQSRTDVIAA